MSAQRSETILGLDVGVASIGWSLLERTVGSGRLLAAGVYAFEPPEEKDSQGNVAGSNRKRHGDMKRRRRQLRRRALRMKLVRKALNEHEPPILMECDAHALGRALQHCAALRPGSPVTPWLLRKDGLSRELSADEWAVVLGHLVGHRAYFSNAKRKGSNDSGGDKSGREQKGVLEGLRNNESKFVQAVQSGEVESVGEWLGRSERQRNRSGDYQYSIRREWVINEAKLLFSRQRARKNPRASSELETQIIALIRDQKEITSQPVGPCTFEGDQPRAAKHSYSFELFRLLARLNNLRVISPRRESPRLNCNEIHHIIRDFGRHQRITYKTLRKDLSLNADERFDRVPDAEAEKEDVVARKGKGAPGTYALRKVVIENHGLMTWQGLLKERDKVDGIAAAIAHVDALSEIHQRLTALALDPALVATLVREADGGDLGFFRGTGHLSLKALSKLETYLCNGLDYYEAQIAAKYDPSKDRFSRKPGIAGDGPVAVRKWLGTSQIEELITSQVASRAVRETFKLVLAVFQQHGHADIISIEMAREVGKSAKDRNRIEADQRVQESRREALRRSFTDCFERPPSEAEETRWALWNEQQGKCAFTGDDMHCTWVLDGDERVQVEHILPRSRFGINSRDNKVLCREKANQNKNSKTPYEWLSRGGGPVSWEEFQRRAKHMFESKEHRRKLENLLIVDVSKMEDKFKNRDLNDTRWITKFLLAGLTKLSTQNARVRVQPVNAGLVSMLRHAWCLSAWKRDPKDPRKRRNDDRHHALDAAIVATIEAGLVVRLTQAYQRAEELERDFALRKFPPPWPGFQRMVLDHIYGLGAADEGPARFTPVQGKGVFVVRPESRRARGPIFKEMYYSVRPNENGGEVAYEFLRIEDFEEADLLRVKDRQRQHKLVAKLEEWVARGRPLDDPPVWGYRDAGGGITHHPIRRVRVQSRHRPTLRVETGDDRGECTPKPSVKAESIVRLDVFRSPAGELAVVPVYRHHLASRQAPANIVINGIEQTLGSDFCFQISIYRKTYVQLLMKENGIIEGYFRFYDRDSSRITVTPHFTLDRATGTRVSVSKIRVINKLVVARLGVLIGKSGPVSISQEKRTWRRVADQWHGAEST